MNRMPGGSFLIIIVCGCGVDNKGKESDLHLITDVAYYENGSTTPSLETPLLVLDDYSVNLFKYFWEVFLEKFK